MMKKHTIMKMLASALLLVTGALFSHAANGIIEIQTYTQCVGDEISFDGGKTVITKDTIIYDTVQVANVTMDSVYVYIINTYPVNRFNETRELEIGSSFVWHGQTISKPGEYQDIHKNVHGCDSSYYLKVTERLPATLYYNIKDTSICEGSYYDWEGVRYTSSDTVYKFKKNAAGDRDSLYILYLHILPLIRQTEVRYFTSWPAQYRDSLLAAPGVYDFVYKGQNGCDSIIRVMANQQVITVPETATICQGESFTWQGTAYKEGGQYQKIVKTKDGKHDSIYYQLYLNVLPTKRSYITKTICRGSSFTFNGKTYTDKDAGVITQTIKTSGCDSIVQLTLIVADADTVRQVHQISDGENYAWNGMTLTETGKYYYTTTNRTGCDSIVELTLTKKHVTQRDTTVYICEGGSYTWQGITGSETYDYTRIEESAGEIRSYTLHMIVNKVPHRWEEVQAESFPFTYREWTFTEAGSHDFTYLTNRGCDSIITVVVNKRILVEEEKVTICPGETYKWGYSGYREYGETGIYQEVEKTKDGTRDSIYHVLNLTVRYIPTTYVNATICEGGSYSFGGMTYYQAGMYTHKFKVDGCDSTVVLSLNLRAKDTVLYAHQIKEGEIFNWNGEQYNEPGVYDRVGTNRFGCDSVSRLILTYHHVDTIDTVATICQGETLVWHGINGRETHQYSNIETLANGDQVIYRLNLTVKEVKEVEKTLQFCQGGSVTFNGKSYSAAGTYYDRYNCDTVFRIVVTQNPVREFITNATFDGKKPYEWVYYYHGEKKGGSYPNAGTYNDYYTDEETGCVDTYRLILTLDNTEYHFEEALTVCEGEEFEWHGKSGLSKQGIGETRDYYDRYKTISGNDSIYHLALTVMPLKRSSRTITFCEQTVFNGKTYTESAVVYDTVASAIGCDSIIRIYLDKAPKYLFHDTATIVEGEILNWYDMQINTNGLYRKAFTTINGCDSIYELGVGLIAATPQKPTFTTKWSICEGDVYVWDYNGKEYSVSGTYVEVKKADLIDDPDTTYVLNLTVWPVNKDTVIQHLYACGSENVIRYNGQEYFSDATIVTTYKTIHNCDSVVKTFLHFNTALFTSDTMHIADNDTTRMWHGQKINHAGTYKYEEKIAEGECYNREELIVFMYPTYLFVKDTAICQSEAPYKWLDGPQDKSDIEYSHTPGETKTYQHKYVTVNGYDSIYELHLTIYPSYIVRQQLHLCEGEQRYVNGKLYQNLVPDSVYRDTTMIRTKDNCDSIIYTEIIQHPIKRIVSNQVLHMGDTIFWEGDTITRGGGYQKVYEQAVNGCDSIIELHVTQEMLEEKVICLLDTPFEWRGHMLNTTGFWRDTVRDDRNFITELWKLDLTITTPPDTTIYLQGCDKQGVTWRDKVYLKDTVDTVYVPVIPQDPMQPCDSIFTVKVRIDTTYNLPLDTVYLCEHELPLIIGRQNPDTVWAEDIYTHKDTTACGCDSTINVRLIIIPNLTKNDSVIVCERDIRENPVVLGDTVTPAFISKEGGKWADERYWKGPEKWKWHGVKYQDDTIVWNCDSSYFFHIIVKPQVINNDTIYLCEGDSVQIGWPEPIWVKEQGVYSDTLQSYKGWWDKAHNRYYDPNDFSCDSITRYEVIFTHPLYGDTTAHIPQGDSIMWDGEWRHFSGDYIRITQAPDTNYAGEHCKKVDTLHLFVEPTYYFCDTIEFCGDPNKTYSHQWDQEGKHVQYFNTPSKDMSVHYYDSLKTVPWRFDSIYDLYVKFREVKRTRISYGICEGDSLRFGLTKSHRPRFLYTTGIYTDTLVASSNGCDSIIELTLNVYPKHLTHKNIDIADVDTPYVWEHVQWSCGIGYVTRDTLYATGEYAYHMENQYGCDSIDSISLRIHQTYLYKDTVTICSNETPYSWEGIKDIYETGTFTKKYLTKEGYDSTLVRHVIVIPIKKTTIHKSICEGDSIRFGLSKMNRERFVHNAGTYYDTLRTTEGCDSIVTLILNIYPKILNHKTVDIADVDTPYVWEHPIIRGTEKDTLRDSLYATGEYSRRLESILGCDSIDSLTLRIHNTYKFTEEISVCERDLPYIWMNRNDITTSGTYYYNPRTKDGYDSIFIANITVVPTQRKTINHSMCEGSEYIFAGKTYTTGVTVNDTLVAHNGCDSIVTLILTVNKPYHHVEKVDILQGQSVMFFGTEYSVSGTYTHFNSTPEGCDSTSILQLTVHPLIDTTITVCASELPYIWHNKWSGKEEKYYAAGTYRNDSTFDMTKHFYGMQLIVNDPVFKTINHSMCEGSDYTFGGKTYNTAVTVKDTLRAHNGCDSIVTLILTVNKPYHHVEKVDILQGQSVMFFGTEYSVSGTYTHFNSTPEGCDSTSILQLTVHPLIDTTITVCASELPYIWHNKWSGKEEKYYAAGTYRNDSTFDMTKHFYGMQLIVNEPVFKTINHSMCEGSDYTFGGKTYNTGVTVKDTLRAHNGCDSIVTLILTVNKPYHHVEKVDILQGQSVMFFGTEYSVSGTYTHFNSTPEGCDSTSILQLTVHPLIDTTITVCASELPYIWHNKWSGKEEKYYAAGTYRNDSTFDMTKHFYGMQLIVNDPVFKTINHSMCEGSDYTFGGKTYNTGVTVKDTLRAHNGCDSIVTLILTVNKPYHHVEKVDILQGQSVMFFGTEYSVSGTYTHFNSTPEGCDSTSILQLTVHPLIDTTITVCASELPYIWHNKWSGREERYYASGTYRNDSTFDMTKHFYGMQLIVNDPVFKTINHSMCEGSDYTFGGKTYNTAVTVKDTLRAHNGCDSIVTLILTVNKPYHHVEKVDILQGQSVMFFGTEYSVSGTYTHFNSTPEGCDSTSILQLTVHPLIDTTITVCASELPYIWHNKWSGKEEKYYAAGTYRNDSTFDMTKHFYGMQLIVNDPVFKTINHSMCEGSDYTFGGKTYNTAVTVKDTLRAHNGCDSIVTLILTVNKPYHHVEKVDILQGQSVMFFGTEYSVSGTYTHFNSTPEGCDSTSILQLTVHPLIDTTITVCASELPYIWHNKWSGREEKYYAAGTYRNDSTFDMTKHFYGMQLIVNDPVFKTINHSMCEGSDYTFGGKTYNTGVTVKDTLRAHNGCDSIVTLILTVNKPYHHVEKVDILQGQSVMFFGTEYSVSGTYTHFNSTPEGCDSTSILQLTVHPLIDTTITVCASELPYIWHNKWSGKEERYYAAGTYRNDSTFDMTKHFYGMQLIVNDPVFKTINHSMCEGSTYTFDGKSLKVAGTYYDTLTSHNGCDSVVTLVLTVNKPYHHVEKVDILQGQSVMFFGTEYNVSGTYTHFNSTPEGCDSTSILQLTVHPLIDTTITVCASELPYIWHNKWSGKEERYYAAGTYRNDSTFDMTKHFYGMQLIVNDPVFKTINHSMCEGSTYTFDGKSLKVAGTYYDTLTSHNGCDSVVTLVLTVNKPYYHVETVDILEGQSFDFFGNSYNATGAYTHYNTTPEGCDSTSILQLTVHQLVDTTVTICSTELPYTWVNKWTGEKTLLYHAGLYRNDTTYVNGKRMFFGLKLNVHMPSDTILYRSICEGSTYNFKGIHLSKQGEYRDTLRNINGCDSIVRLLLTVLPKYHNIINRTIYEGDTVHFMNNVYDKTGRYPFRFTSSFYCDSIIELNLTVKRLFDDSVSVCQNELPLEWRNKKIYQSGIFRDTTYDSDGTQVISGLKVTVLPTYRASEPIVKTICDGDYYVFNHRNLTVSGTYYDTLTAVNGCDSIISLSLQVTPQTLQSTKKVIYEGDSALFNGEWKKESGIYEYTQKSANGCVDTYQLILVVLKQFNTDTTAYVCENDLPFIWHNVPYNQSGDYSLPTSWTDSSRVVTTLHLTVYPVHHFERNIDLCEGSTFIYKNKEYQRNGFFFDTIPSRKGCDSICKYIISVHPTYDRIDTVHISDKQTYNFNGRPLNQSGYYESSDTTVNGCDSLVHLVLIVHPSYYNYDSINLCQGDTLQWHGQKIFKSGLYSDSLLTDKYNFDSVYQVRVIVHEKYFLEQQYEITEGYPTYIHGINISKPGVYYDSLLTIHGCDSVYQIVVNWARKFTQHQSVTICQGDYYDFFGTRLTHAGEYDHTSLMGDSTIYLKLTVNPTSVSENRIVISPEDLPYIYNERAYEAGGVYTDTFHNRFRCDSITRLVLVVSDHVSEWDQMPLCPGQSIKIDGQVITEAGLYTFTKRSKVSGLLDSLYRVEVFDAPDFESPIDSIVLCEGDTAIFAGRQIWRAGSYTASLKTKNGCDSILHMHLTINPSYRYTTAATITDYQTYTWRGKEYTQTGIYEQSYPTVKDCDSTYALNLTVLETQRIVVTDSICYRDTLRWRDHILSEPGIYSDTICNLASLTSIIYTLRLGVVTPTIINSATVTETAADVESFDIRFTYSGIRPSTYSIQFDEPAHKEGFVDIVNKPFGADIVAVVPMPHKEQVVYQEHTAYVRPNYYTMRLALDNGVCGVSRSDSLSLLIRYPSWILEQNWDDVVAPLRSEYNGGYEFGAYTWYVNDAVFPNDGLPYLYTKSLRPGDKVVLYATRMGESYAIPTAPLTITAPLPSVFQNPVLVYPTTTSKLTPHVTLQAQSNGSYRVYSATGKLFSTGNFESGEQQIEIPATSGCCLIQAMTEDGNILTQKILVY